MFERIDELARVGYQYAVSNGQDNQSHLIEDDMDLMAFNAGISNANLRNSLNTPKLGASPTERSHDNYHAHSDKELALCWGNG
jgi:hypothetical protein